MPLQLVRRGLRAASVAARPATALVHRQFSQDARSVLMDARSVLMKVPNVWVSTTISSIPSSPSELDAIRREVTGAAAS